ncbi:gelsolin repeat domain-containing protein [Phthorimaea operculella]|nr:gelsolin repeat domain-containing protein [Phthorimaea operculella]
MKASLLCALALLACAYARTATRAPAVSAHITSLTDKDARTKGMTHPAFANAGKQAGIEIWRIEDFEPVLVPAKDYGKFYKGDSYIILKTNSDKKGNLSWDIHYWIGAESSQDESGAAAILTVGLDDKFNGAAIQHRETMGYESSQFAGYFKPAIRYLDGGHASGFNHVTTNPGAEKRLFQVKGKRNVRVRQVDPVISSMNKGDVFILDKDQDIYVFVGEKAKNVEKLKAISVANQIRDQDHNGRGKVKNVEKLKAISVANQIRDQDHNGRGKVEIIDQYSSEVDVQKFFTALGSGNRQLVPDESAGGDDQQFERSEEQSVTLSEISDSTGSIKITPLNKPYTQAQLKPQEVYILDTVSGSIYVWVGKQSTDKEKSEAMTKAQQYLTAKKYPSWVHVARIPQGTEPAVFKQYFTTWRDTGASHSRLVRSASGDSLYASDDSLGPRPVRPEVSPRLFTVSLTSDNQLIYTENDFAQSELQSDEAHIVDTGEEVFVWVGEHTTDKLRKSANIIAEEAHIVDTGEEVFVWVGEHTTDKLRKSANIIAEAYLSRFGSPDRVATVTKQGLEPDTLTALFEEWDPDMWMKQRMDEQDRERELELNEIDVDK